MVYVALLVVAGCATEGPLGTDEDLPAKVVRLKGGVRWSSDDGKTWREVKLGNKLRPGNLVQTASDSYIDVRLGELTTEAEYDFDPTPSPVQIHMPSSTGLPRRNDPEPAKPLFRGRVPGRIMRLWANSQVSLDRLTMRLARGGARIAEDLKFDLRAGHVVIYIGKSAGDTQCEIKFPKGLVCISRGMYDVHAEGVVLVRSGKALVTWPGSPSPQIVLGLQMFDVRTGVLSVTQALD